MSDESSKESRVIGPVLRPDEVAPASGIGPALPLHLFKSRLENTAGESEDEDPFIIGPLIPGQESKEEIRHFRTEECNSSTLENRSSKSLKRDAWMTELLPASQGVQSLKARRFQRSVGPGGTTFDSSWFQSPSCSDDKDNPTEAELKKRLIEDENERKRNESYDKKMAECVSKCQDGKETASLLDLHRRKAEHKAKKEAKKARKEARRAKKEKHKHKKHKHTRSPSPEKPTRRPFDRDIDLKISRIDSAAKNALIERSKKLSGRFGHGSKQFL
ncbi:unnamed protein product [Calicophoron daubneyi]